jgi:hypothetical protein
VAKFSEKIVTQHSSTQAQNKPIDDVTYSSAAECAPRNKELVHVQQPSEDNCKPLPSVGAFSRSSPRTELRCAVCGRLLAGKESLQQPGYRGLRRIPRPPTGPPKPRNRWSQ